MIDMAARRKMRGQKRKGRQVSPSKQAKALRKTLKGKYWEKYADEATDALMSYTTTSILKDEKFEIEKIYVRSNKAVHFAASEGEFGVKLKSGGYAILRNGVLYKETDYRNALKGLDVALGGYDNTEFTDLWDSLDSKEKAKLSVKLRGIDWNKVWSTDYDKETGLMSSETAEMRVVEAIKRTVRPSFRE